MSLSIGHPLFLHGGHLGFGGQQVLNALDIEEGQKRAQIAAATGLRPGDVSRALTELAKVGAAHRGPDRLWYRSISFDPDTTARDLGLQAKAIKRDRRLDQEAANHHVVITRIYRSHQGLDPSPITLPIASPQEVPPMNTEPEVTTSPPSAIQVATSVQSRLAETLSRRFKLAPAPTTDEVMLIGIARRTFANIISGVREDDPLIQAAAKMPSHGDLLVLGPHACAMLDDAMKEWTGFPRSTLISAIEQDATETGPTTEGGS